MPLTVGCAVIHIESKNLANIATIESHFIATAKTIKISRSDRFKKSIEKPGISILIAGFKVITLFLTDDFQLSQT
jgi:hypothetical protein